MATNKCTNSEEYCAIVATSERVAWTTEEIFRDRCFDATKNMVPDSWVRTQHLTFLTAKEQRTLNHLRAFSYVHLFGGFEEFIPIHLFGRVQEDWHADRTQLRALLRFGEEEMKHQQLFQRAEVGLEAAYGYSCGRYFDRGRLVEVTRAILAHPPLARTLILLALEWGSQRHYVDSVQKNAPDQSDPLYADILKYHWIEESQHTKTGELEITQLAQGMSPAEISSAFDQLLSIGGVVDAVFTGQVEQELSTFQHVTGRQLAESDVMALRDALNMSMRAIWVEVSFTHPNFMRVAVDLSKEGAAKLGIR